MQEKVKVWAAYTVLLLGGGAVLYLFFRHFAAVLLPFVLGWGIALAVRCPADFLHRKTKVPRGVARLLLALLAAGVLGVLSYFGLRGVFHELSLLVEQLGSDGGALAERLREWLSAIPLIGEQLATGNFLQEGLTVLLSEAPALLSRLAGFLPSFFFSFGVAVIAAVYFCLDLDRIHAAISRRLPEAIRSPLRSVKDSALRAALAVFRAQGILMLIAFAFMLVGFFLLKVKFPLLLSAIFALLDFLPVLGVGTFLIPWGIVSLLIGYRRLGIGLLILYAVITAVRQFIEPHLIGGRHGVHPLLTLLSLYAGGRLFGFFGLLLFPIITLLLYEVLFSEDKRESV